MPLIYAIRFSARANREIAEATVRFAAITGDDDMAKEWLDGVYYLAATLATNPARFSVQPDESRKLGCEVRRVLYQRSAGTGASTHAYHLYFKQEKGDDGPLVTVIHVRHASRKPLTRTEAKDILAGQ